MDADADLLDRSNDELLAEIGQAVRPDALVPRSIRDHIAAGQQWFESHFGEMRDVVCRHRDRIESSGDGTAAVAAIIDVLSSVNGVPAIASVSVLLYRYGIAQLCDDSVRRE